MSNVHEIERAIANLPDDDFLRLREAIQKRFDDRWDRQFESDVASGKLDRLGARAIKEHRAGLSKPFPPDAQ